MGKLVSDIIESSVKYELGWAEKEAKQSSAKPASSWAFFIEALAVRSESAHMEAVPESWNPE